MRKQILLNPVLRRELEEYQNKIYLLCNRFNRSIDEHDILKWLKNFEPDEWDDALTVLENVEYLDDAQLLEAYDYCLQKILDDTPIKVDIEFKKGRKIKKRKKKSKIIVIPVGMYGKSGTAMIYYLKKTRTFYENSHRFILAENSEALSDYQGKQFYFLFVDDYFGSGDSAVDYFEEKIKDLINPLSYKYWISVVSQVRAEKVIQSKVNNCKVISWKSRDKAFLRDRSPFGNRERVRYFRNFCYKYGEILVSEEPLGYKNTQGMVTFSYGAPNNLLPIFWSSNKRWVPIFPRYSKDRMAWSKEFRKETAYWLSLARILKLDAYHQIATGRGITQASKKYSYILRIDFRLFCVIRMLRQRRPVPIICQVLGISTKDYEEVIEEGINRKMLDDNGILTEYGERTYREVLNKVLEYKFQETKPMIEPSTTLYIPQSFRGIT